MSCVLWDVITHPGCNFNGGIAKPLSMYEWISNYIPLCCADVITYIFDHLVIELIFVIKEGSVDI